MAHKPPRNLDRLFDLAAMLASNREDDTTPAGPELRDRMAEVGYFLDDLFNDDLGNRITGFVLVLCPYHLSQDTESRRCSMLTNVNDPRDTVRLLASMTERLAQDVNAGVPMPLLGVPDPNSDPEPQRAILASDRSRWVSTFAAAWAQLDTMLARQGAEAEDRKAARGMFYMGAVEMLELLTDDADPDAIKDELIAFIEQSKNEENPVRDP